MLFIFIVTIMIDAEKTFERGISFELKNFKKYLNCYIPYDIIYHCSTMLHVIT